MSTNVIAEGPPPLTAQAADAAIDVIDFMAAVVRGVDLIDVTPDMRERWRAYLTQYYPTLQQSDRFFFASADMSLAQIESGWAQTPPQQQEMYRQIWGQSLAALLNFASPVIGAQPAVAAPQAQFAAQAPAAPVPAPAPPPRTNGLGDGSSMSDLMGTIRAEQARKEQEAFQQGGAALQQQVQMQNDAMNMQMLTNMSQMQYQAMMAVAKNMKY
jgi:hypothetical protein